MHLLALLVRHANHPEGSTPIHGGERAGIAVVDDGIAALDQLSAIRRDALIDLNILIGEALRLSKHQVTQVVTAGLPGTGSSHDPVQGPRQVDGCGPSGF